MRLIEVNDKCYCWSIGKSNVVITTAHGEKPEKKMVISFTDLLNETWDNIERAQRKGYFHITPRIIRAYIEKNFVV